MNIAQVEYTFTATIPKTYQSMIGVGGAFVTQQPQSPVGSTFNFKGIFDDVNKKQSFRINYTDGTSYEFEFTKVKSLFYDACTPIQPNQSTLTIPLCQTTNQTISFSNLQWKTAFETPALCFGSITTYEYLLPSGWSLNGTTSTGGNWIAGSNNVSITPDATTGDGESVQIRPVNPCGSGLDRGASTYIPISRSGPTLSITGSQDYICSGSENYTINGVPSGGSVQWSVSNTSQASITAGGTSTTVTISRTGSSNIVLTLTATVSNCGLSFEATYDIALGTPPPNPIDVILADPTLGKLQVVSEPAVPGSPDYRWYKNGILQSIYHGTFAQMAIPRNVCDVSYDISVTESNACGTSAATYKDAYVPCYGSYYLVSPNPAKRDFTVSQDVTKSTTSNRTFTEVRIYDLQGTLKKQQKFNNTTTGRISVSGLQKGPYVVEIINGQYRERHQLLIQ